MRRLSRAEVRDRYYELWGRLESVRFGADGDECVVRVHREPDEVLRIRAIGLVHATIDRQAGVAEIAISERGPMLWPFEPEGQVFVNSPLDVDAVIAHVAAGLHVDRAALGGLRGALGGTPPFSLRVAMSLHLACVAAFDALGVAYHEALRPRSQRALVALALGDSTLIAHDFEIDLVEEAR
jgi:hypothetical protein